MMNMIMVKDVPCCSSGADRSDNGNSGDVSVGSGAYNES